MTLDYLDFDYSEDADGHGSFDAMAAVTPAQWPTLQEEVQRVLAWAERAFAGERGPLEDGGQWDFELQGVREVPTPLDLRWDDGSGQLQVREQPAAAPRITLSFTLSGTPAFCDALRQAFALD